MFDSKLENIFFNILNNQINNVINSTDNMTYMPGGNNGPHYALETPIRNSCHLLFCYSVAFLMTQNNNYIKIAEKIVKWLVYKNNQHINNEYHYQRAGFSTDTCNGVIGPAWIIESINMFLKVCNNDALKKKLNKIVSQNKYNYSVHAWHRYDPITNNNRVDYTLDHQLWYASSIINLPEKKHEVNDFVSNLNNLIYTDKNGRLSHLMRSNTMQGKLMSLNYNKKYYYNKLKYEEIEKSYHLYTLFPLAKIYLLYHADAFFNSEKFSNILKYLKKKTILETKSYKLGYSYNTPIFDLPFIYDVFENKINLDETDLTDIVNDCTKFLRYDGKQFVSDYDNLIINARIYQIGYYLIYKKYGNKYII
jgi:hypothetical protein